MPKKSEVKLQTAKTDTERSERRTVLEPVVLGVVSALGGYEDVLVDDPSGSDDGVRTERVYKLGDECLGCLKDLKKFWRLDDDDENRTVARILHFSQILPNDLLPILMSVDIGNKKDDRVALLCSDLIAALTWPINVDAELKEAFEIEDEEARRKASSVDFSGLIAAQLSYKRDIIRTGAMGHIFRLILPIIQKGRNQRTGKDDNIISLVLYIIRNLLALRDKPPSALGSSTGLEESYLQSDFILQLSKFGIFDLLIHMSYGSNRFDLYGQWNMIVLDIWHLLFRGIDAEELIDAEAFSGTNEAGEIITTTKAGDKKLESLLLEEEKERKVKARRSATRHSRFGTTLTVKTGERKYNLHHQTAITTPVELALEARKKQKKKATRLKDEFGLPTLLKPAASAVLRKVVIEFIESGFNPFFLSVLKDIRMEKAKDLDGIRFSTLLGFFLRAFLTLKEREKFVGISPTSEAGHDFDLIAELIEPECILWVVSKIKSGLEDKPMPVVEVHSAVECLIQQLLVIEGLSASGVEDYSQVANVILNKLYYDSETLDMVIHLMSKYTNQSLKYLENIVHFSYVFLRILERYAQSTDYMYVRKKKPRKARTDPEANNSDGQPKEAEDGIDIITAADEEEQEFLADQKREQFAEHKFEFGKFQARFANEAVLKTLITYIRGYEDFHDPELMKRAVKLMFRQAVNATADKLFFKVSILDTFNTIIENKASMPKHPAYTDLFRFIDYILKQYFKSVREDSFVLVEVLFNNSMREWSRTLDDDSSDDSDSMPMLKKKTRKPLKLPAEIVVKPGLTWSQRLGVAIGLLVDRDKSDLVTKVQDLLRTVSAARTAIVLMTDQGADDEAQVDLEAWFSHPDEELSDTLKAQLRQPSQSALDKFEDHRVHAANDPGFEKALQRDAEFHMLLRLLHWESLEEYPGYLRWTIPKTRLHSELDVDIKVMDYFLINPLDHNGKSAAQLTKKKRKTQRRTRRSRLDEDLNGDELALDDSDASGRKKAGKKSRKARKQMEVQKYRSAQFVADSDDEENEERDRLFFERERQLRARIDSQLAQREINGTGPAPRPPSRKPGKRLGPVRTGAKTVAPAQSAPEDGTPSSPSMDVGDLSGVQSARDDESTSSSSSAEESGSDSDKALRTTTTPAHSSPHSSPHLSSHSIQSPSEVIGRKRNLNTTPSHRRLGNKEGDEEEDDIEMEMNPKRFKSRKVFVGDSDEE